MKGISETVSKFLLISTLELGCSPFVKTDVTPPENDSISFYEWEQGRKKAEAAAIARANAMVTLDAPKVTDQVAMVTSDSSTPAGIAQKELKPQAPAEFQPKPEAEKISLPEPENEEEEIVILTDQEGLTSQPNSVETIAQTTPQVIPPSPQPSSPELDSVLLSDEGLKQVAETQRKTLFLKLDPHGFWQAAVQLPCAEDINRRLFANPPQYVDGDDKCLEAQQYNCENGIVPPAIQKAEKNSKKIKSKSKPKKVRLTLEQMNEIDDNIEWRGVECALTSNRIKKVFNPNAY